MTLREWSHNLERDWAQAVCRIGERIARVWRLYMAGSRVGFELSRLEVHHVLGVHAAGGGHAGSPRPQWTQRALTGDASANRA